MFVLSIVYSVVYFIYFCSSFNIGNGNGYGESRCMRVVFENSYDTIQVAKTAISASWFCPVYMCSIILHCSVCLQPNRDVRIRCSLIVSLLLRQEFRYDRIASYQQQTFHDISAALPANTASRYFQLLCKSVEWATNTLNKQTISASTLQGCMKLLAICYYRLPTFGEMVREMIQKQVTELERIVEPKIQGESTKRILVALHEYTNVADAVGRSVTEAYRKLHGDIFLWGKLAAHCDYRLNLPSNNRWKRHVCVFDEGFSQFFGSAVKLITHHFREDTSGQNMVLWHAIPGYTAMLRRYVFSNIDVQRYCCRNSISRCSRQTFNQRQVSPPPPFPLLSPTLLRHSVHI